MTTPVGSIVELTTHVEGEPADAGRGVVEVVNAAKRMESPVVRFEPCKYLPGVVGDADVVDEGKPS